MLFLPLLDRKWLPPSLPRNRSHFIVWAVFVLAALFLVAWQPEQAGLILSMLLFTALPEEWFFRAYFMTRLGQSWRANLATSLLFSLLHGLTRGWATALLVFTPSLFYGWLYQRTRDLPLLVLLHALSNLVFVLFLTELFATFQGYLR